MTKLVREGRLVATLWLLLVPAIGCSDDAGDDDTDDDIVAGDAGSGGDAAASDAGDARTQGDSATDAAAASDTGQGDAGQSDGGTVTASCSSATTDLDKAVCAANALLATLSSSELSSLNLAFSASASRTQWSNLPGVTRAGLKMGSLSTTSQSAALALMQTLLSTAGVSDLTGIRAADDYLGTQGGGMGGMGGGSTYAASNYYVAILGTPSTTENWEVMFGGHHMAYNITFLGGIGYPVPNHLGVEPKASFTIDNVSYAPLEDEGTAILAAFNALSATELSSAYLTGQTFADVLIGPVEFGTGSSSAAKAKYPTGSNRTGVLVSTLSAAQQALVTSAIQGWVGDYNASIADALLSAYTSSAAYADTYLAWGGTQSAGVDPEVNGTYMRIDGPRVWIEVSCQAGVVIQGKTHYHTIFRDKQYDYAGTL